MKQYKNLLVVRLADGAEIQIDRPKRGGYEWRTINSKGMPTGHRASHLQGLTGWVKEVGGELVRVPNPYYEKQVVTVGGNWDGWNSVWNSVFGG